MSKLGVSVDFPTGKQGKFKETADDWGTQKQGTETAKVTNDKSLSINELWTRRN